ERWWHWWTPATRATRVRRLLPHVPVAGDRETEPAEREAGERCLKAVVSEVGAQRQARRAGKGELAATKRLEAETVVGHVCENQRRRVGLPLPSGTAAEIRAYGNEVRHMVFQRAEQAGGQLKGRDASRCCSIGDLISRHAELDAEPVARPRARRCAEPQRRSTNLAADSEEVRRWLNVGRGRAQG